MHVLPGDMAMKTLQIHVRQARGLPHDHCNDCICARASGAALQ